jgi:hypothetical protein
VQHKYEYAGQKDLSVFSQIAVNLEVKLMKLENIALGKFVSCYWKNINKKKKQKKSFEKKYLKKKKKKKKKL